MGLKVEFKLAMAKDHSVFELLRFDCIYKIKVSLNPQLFTMFVIYSHYRFHFQNTTSGVQYGGVV